MQIETSLHRNARNLIQLKGNIMLCSHLTFAFVFFFCLNITVKHKDGFRPILCVCVCVSIDTILNFDGDVEANANANFKCEQGLR